MTKDTALNFETKLVVSIINYKTAELTLQCVQSVLDDLHDIDGYVAIVDNRSDDGSIEKISTWITEHGLEDRVELIASETNSGFSGGHNKGIGAKRAEFYLVLNSDAVVKRGFFSAILDAAENHSDHGFFAPRIDYDDGGQQISCFRFPSPRSELIRGAETGPVTRIFKNKVVPLEMPPDAGQIDWASFACILLRGRMIEDTGPMDEGYFLYFEDVEYCWRAQQKGWLTLYVPDAHAIHFRGGSGPVKSLARQKKRLPAYYYASRTRLLYQMYGTGGLLLANLTWIFGRAIAVIRVLAGKKIPPSNAQEYRDIWINFFTPLGDNHQPKT